MQATRVILKRTILCVDTCPYCVFCGKGKTCMHVCKITNLGVQPYAFQLDHPCGQRAACTAHHHTEYMLVMTISTVKTEQMGTIVVGPCTIARFADYPVVEHFLIVHEYMMR